MLYTTEIMRKARSLVRHAYSDYIARKGRSVLMVCTKRRENKKRKRNPHCSVKSDKWKKQNIFMK